MGLSDVSKNPESRNINFMFVGVAVLLLLLNCLRYWLLFRSPKLRHASTPSKSPSTPANKSYGTKCL